MTRPKPCVLCILDGWGYNPSTHGNAIAMARKPNIDRWNAQYPHTLIHTSGAAVGLPDGQMGNSEVGHLNMGAGRIIHMDITRLDQKIESGEFFRHPLLLSAMEKGRAAQLHLLGLLSDGGVHSHQNHLYALLRMAAEHKVERVLIHVFLDGRDTPPHSGAGFIEALQQKMREFGVGRIASVCGRYYAMDRDKRWERTERAYKAIVIGQGQRTKDPVAAVRASYEHGVTDEFVEPIVIEPVAEIRDGDSAVFFNFRADRARQMTRALAGQAPLPSSPTSSQEAALAWMPAVPNNLFLVTLTHYDKTLAVPFVQGPEPPANILANVLAAEGLKNLRVAETEKYAHVTYFFNGGNEKPYPGEDRVLIPSPKVATYDLMPEMSAAGVAEAVVKAVEGNAADFIVVNFANADMVGHSGKIEPTIKAVETVDGCVGSIFQAVTQKNGVLMVTADHGNAEVMIDPVTGGPHTYHTTNPVPLLLISDTPAKLRENGSLRDLAPTLLGLMGLPKPAEMTGQDLRL